MPTLPPDNYPAVAREDLTDGKLVAGRLDNLAREVASGFERLELALARFAEHLNDDRDRIEELERQVAQLQLRVA